MFVLTGGAGFIGSAFLSHLNAQGIDRVLVVDNLGSTEKWKNLVGKKFDDYMHKDEFLRRVEANELPTGIQTIVHLGACSSTTERNAEYMMRNNFQYSKTLAEWALRHNTRFLYASSAATYGDGSFGFSDDDVVTKQLRPLNVYALSKQLFDEWALRSKASAKMVGWKFFNVFGPNEYHKGDMISVVRKSYEHILETGRVKLFKSYHPDFGDGEQKRDFIYVKDCCSTMWQFIEHPRVSGIFNVGTGTAHTWKELIHAVFSAMHLPPAIDFIDMPETLRGKYQYYTEADTSKLRSSIPLLPPMPLADSVRDYVQNYLAKDSAIY